MIQVSHLTDGTTTCVRLGLLRRMSAHECGRGRSWGLGADKHTSTRTIFQSDLKVATWLLHYHLSMRLLRVGVLRAATFWREEFDMRIAQHVRRLAEVDRTPQFTLIG